MPLQLNTQSRVLASHSHVIFVERFLSSVPLYGMCLFSAFSANLDVNATLKKNVKERERERKKPKHISKLWRVGGFGG